MNNWKTRFFIIWFGQAVSILTSSILQMALIWRLSIQTNSAAILSVASIAGFLPAAILGLFAGALVDRWNRKLTMVGADLLIALISLVLAVYAYFADVPVWLVLAVLFLRSIGAAFHSPAISAVTPLIVPPEALTKCAGYTSSLQTVGYIAGAAIAAVLYPIWSMSALVMLDVFGAVFASAMVLVVKIPSPPPAESPVAPNILFEMREGYRILRGNKGIFALVWVSAIFMFLYSPINALYPLMTFDHFGGTTTHASITEITFAVGMLLGGLALGAWGGLKNRGHSILLAMLVMGGAIGLSGLLPASGFIGFAALCVCMGLSVPFYSGPLTALMQEKYEPQYLGRVFGLFSSITAFAMPLGLVLSGLFADSVGIANYFAIIGAACVALTVAACFVKSVRTVDQ